MANQQESTKKPDVDSRQAAKALQYLLAAGYVDKKRLYFENFVRGIFFSLGSVIGAALVITILIWFLSLFKHLPLVGHFVQTFRNSINSVKVSH